MSVRSLVGTTLRLAVPLYLSTLLLGLLPAALAMLGLALLAADRPWRADLLSPGWMNTASEIVMTAVYAGGLPGVTLVMLAALLAFPLMMLAQLVVYSYLVGGILAGLSRATTGPKRGPAPSFRASCREWFWPSFRLSMLGGVLAVVAMLAGAGMASLGRASIGPEASLVIPHILLAIVLGWVELARAWMVTSGQRSVGRGLERATRAMIRPVVLLAWILLALPTNVLTVVAILPPTPSDAYSPLALVQALLFGQVVAFLGAWTKVVRLAVAVRIVPLIRPASAPASVGQPSARAG
jgi:hypothetical protein